MKMAPINVEQPVSTPADTTSTLHTTSAQKGGTPWTDSASGASTPGVELPGAFPREVLSQTKTSSMTDTREKRTPHAAATRLADASPPKDVQESAKAYLPNVDVQHAIDTAKAYLPESVVGAIGSVLPASMSNGTQSSRTEKNLDLTSGAKPALLVDSPRSGSASLENASTTASAPSTRTGSFTSDATEGSRTSLATKDVGITGALDSTSQAKPATTTTTTAAPITSASPLSTAGIPDSSMKSPSSPVNSANTAVAMHTLPTPPTSKGPSPTNSRPGGKVTSPPGLGGNPANQKEDKDFQAPNGGSRLNPVNSQHDSDTASPTPPPKDATASGMPPDQPKVITTPVREHVKSGTGVDVRASGTVPAGKGGIPSSMSLKSEISNPHIRNDHEDARKEKDQQTQGQTGQVGHTKAVASSSEDSLNENGGTGNGTEKKEGRVKKVVHKMKDKLSHKGH